MDDSPHYQQYAFNEEDLQFIVKLLKKKNRLDK